MSNPLANLSRAEIATRAWIAYQAYKWAAGYISSPELSKRIAAPEQAPLPGHTRKQLKALVALLPSVYSWDQGYISDQDLQKEVAATQAVAPPK